MIGPLPTDPMTELAFHQPRRTPWWRYGLGAIAAAFVLALVAELLIRGGERIWLEPNDPDPRVWADEWMARMLPADGFLWRMDPGPYPKMGFVLNELGYRGEPPVDREPGCQDFVVLAFGDSTVFAWGAFDEGMWSTVMAERLAELTDRPIRVHSFAQIASSMEHAIVEAREWIPRTRPDVAILGAGAWNDYTRFHQNPEQTELEAIAAGHFDRQMAIAKSPLQKSAIFRLWRRLYWRWADARKDRLDREWIFEGVFTEAAFDIPRRVPPGRFRQLLEEFVEICAANGTHAVFFTPRLAPSFRDGFPTERKYPIIHLYDNILREVAEENGVDLIDTRHLLMDLAKEYGTEAIWWDWVHWTMFANTPIGEEAARVVGGALLGQGGGG